MINLRIYRVSLLLVAVALVIVMFSLQSVPAERGSATVPEGFDGAAAAASARSLAAIAPNPTTGSEADEALAKQVSERFGQIPGGAVAVQSFGDGLHNVICVLPGESERQVALLAGRDVASGPGVASADASTAALLEIAADFGGTTHTKTLVFVSTDGAANGAEGAKRFAEDYSDIGRVDAAVVISQPASREPSQPLLIPWSSGPQSTAVQLTRTARRAIIDETDRVPADPGPFAELARLAIPSGLGDQAPLIERGIDAVRISSTGELPPAPADDGPDDISAEWLGRFGRAALATMLALDEGEKPEHGPHAYVSVGGNLLPGWALSLLALTLIVPLFAVAIPAIARAARRPQRLIRGIGWVAGRALPFLAALLLVYPLALAGLIPSPDFPYDPATVEAGIKGTIAAVLIAAVFATGLFLIRPWRAPPPPAARAAPAACVALIAFAALGLWFANPYLALLAAPAFHAWLLLTAEETAVGSLLAIGLTFVGLLPLLAAIAALAGRLDAGLGVAWQLLVLIGDRQVGFPTALLGCLLVGCGLAALALARSRIEREPPPEIRVRAAEG
ncbi:MAG: hypothetical protein ACXWDP_00595 [Solirubrobacterales bacterium]